MQQDRGKGPEIVSDRSGSFRLNWINQTIGRDVERGDNRGIQIGNPNLKTPKVELAKFDGTNPREWVKKCQRYFVLNPIVEKQRVLFASMYLVGAAETWFENFFETLEGVTWNMFVALICERIAEEGYENISVNCIKSLQLSHIKNNLSHFGPK